MVMWSSCNLQRQLCLLNASAEVAGPEVEPASLSANTLTQCDVNSLPWNITVKESMLSKAIAQSWNVSVQVEEHILAAFSSSSLTLAGQLPQDNAGLVQRVQLLDR